MAQQGARPTSSGAEALVSEGEELLARNQVVDAAERALKARKLDRGYVPAYLLLAACYARAGQPAKVRRTFQDALANGKAGAKRDAGNDAMVHLSWARFELGQSRPLEAEKHSSAAVKLSPGLETALTVEGLVKQMLGDRDGARSAFTRALKVDPGDVEARSALGEMELDADHPVEAEAQLRAAYEGGERGTRVASLFALALLLNGEDEPRNAEAARVLQEAGNPFNPPSLIAQGMLKERRGDPRAAAQLYREVLSRDPQHDRAQFALARALRSLGDPQASAAMVRYDQLLRTRQALFRIQDRLRREGRIPRLLREEGETLMKAGRLADAERVFEEWATKDPRNPEAKAALGRARAARRR